MSPSDIIIVNLHRQIVKSNVTILRRKFYTQRGALGSHKIGGTLPAQKAARIVVHPQRNILGMVGGNVDHAFSFFAKPPNQLVLILVGAALPAAVRMAVVNRCEPFH